MVITAIVLRIRKWPRPEGAFRIPGGYMVPVIAALIIIWLLAHISIEGITTTGIVIAFLTVLYFAVVHKLRKTTK
jgi:amino acid transporter